MKVFYFFVVLLALASSVAFGYDPSPLQDFCVAINDTKTGGLYGGIFHIFINFVGTIFCVKNNHHKVCL